MNASSGAHVEAAQASFVCTADGPSRSRHVPREHLINLTLKENP